MTEWTAGTPTTEGTAPASRTEMYLPFAKAGAKLIEMPVFVCFFVRGMGVFVLKCGQK